MGNNKLLLIGIAAAGALALALRGKAEPIPVGNVMNVVCPSSIAADSSGNVSISISVSTPNTNTSAITKTLSMTIGSRSPITRNITMSPDESKIETFDITSITSETSFVAEVI